MKKFENPTLAIRKFNIENIVTTSGAAVDAVDAANAWLTDDQQVSAENVVKFTL